MTFVSLEFAALLAATLTAYYLVGQRARQILLLGASYIFYAYWNPAYAWLILASTAVDYVAARVLERADSRAVRRAALGCSLLGNLGLLAYFKYTDFALESLAALLGPLGEGLPGPLELILPVGISFYTFQTLAYTIDVYRRELEAERDFVTFALFVSFFPQLVAGPIERARDLLPQLRTRQLFDPLNLERGLGRILWGLLKKTVFADRISAFAYPVFLNPGGASTSELALAATAMFAVIYLDFSAYTDIARGVAQLFGIHLSKNFDHPQVATTVSGYWRRWHMTFASWIRDYVVRPLGGTAGASTSRRAAMALLVTLLIGLWHGADWTFVVWGLANGVSVVGYLILRRTILFRMPDRVRASLPWSFASWSLSTVVRILISVLFFAPTFELAWAFYTGLLIDPRPGGPGLVLLAGALAAFLAYIGWEVVQRSGRPRRMLARTPASGRGALYVAAAALCLFGAAGQGAEFIYFQF